MKSIYLDGASTTKIYPEVAEIVKKTSLELYGNPSSQHKLGEESSKLMNLAREKIAKKINAKSHEIYFTSGGTESNNLAIFGTIKPKSKIIISSIEHPSINEVCKNLEKKGIKVKKISHNKNGSIKLDELEKEINNKTSLVSIMHVNNIFGVVQDLEKIGAICKKKNIPFHTDAVQSFGKLKIDVKKSGITLLSASAHKIGGPKGIGIIYIKENHKLSPIFFGGGQEREIRSGTENVPAIVGFAKALEVYGKINKEKIKETRNYLAKKLLSLGVKINTPLENSIYNNLNISLKEINNQKTLTFLSLKKIYVSVGSACDSKKEKEQHALNAISLSEEEISSSIRITIDENTTIKDADKVSKSIEEILHKDSFKNKKILKK